MRPFIILVALLAISGLTPARADNVADLKAASDQWWTLWSPPDAADLDLALSIESEAVGFGFYGEDLRRIEDVDAWRENFTSWLATLQQLDYYPTDREFRVIGATGLEWGHYYERQTNKEGVVTREIRGRYSFTWALKDGAWRMVAYHRSAIPSGPPG